MGNGAGRVAITVVESHRLIRDGLERLVDAVDSLELVGSHPDFKSLEDILIAAPDLLLTSSDISASEVDRLAAVRSSNVKVLILIRGAERAQLRSAYRLKGDGFLMQASVSEQSLGRAVTAIMAGEKYIPGELARVLLEENNNHESVWRPALSPRENDVLGLLAQGLSNKQIASALELSLFTIKRLVASILTRLNCPNRTLAVVRALNEGLLVSENVE